MFEGAAQFYISLHCQTVASSSDNCLQVLLHMLFDSIKPILLNLGQCWKELPNFHITACSASNQTIAPDSDNYLTLAPYHVKSSRAIYESSDNYVHCLVKKALGQLHFHLISS
jgi:hypothetical protein